MALDALGDDVDVLGLGEGDVGPHHRSRLTGSWTMSRTSGAVDLHEGRADPGDHRQARRRGVVDRQVDAGGGERVELPREVADLFELRTPHVDGQTGPELLALLEEAGIGEQLGADVDEQDRAIGRGPLAPMAWRAENWNSVPSPAISGAGQPGLEPVVGRAHPGERLPADGTPGVGGRRWAGRRRARIPTVDHTQCRWRPPALPPLDFSLADVRQAPAGPRHQSPTLGRAVCSGHCTTSYQRNAISGAGRRANGADQSGSPPNPGVSGPFELLGQFGTAGLRSIRPSTRTCTRSGRSSVNSRR